MEHKLYKVNEKGQLILPKSVSPDKKIDDLKATEDYYRRIQERQFSGCTGCGSDERVKY